MFAIILIMSRESPSREDVILALKKALVVVPAKEVGSPSNIYGYAYTDNVPEFKEADQMYDAWIANEEATSSAASNKETDYLRRLSAQTIFWDAGFNGSSTYLDELANDWLMQDERNARDEGLSELADKIKAKINEINNYLNQ